LAFLSVTLPKIPGGCAPWTPLGVRRFAPHARGCKHITPQPLRGYTLRRCAAEGYAYEYSHTYMTDRIQKCEIEEFLVKSPIVHRRTLETLAVRTVPPALSPGDEKSQTTMSTALTRLLSRFGDDGCASPPCDLCVAYPGYPLVPGVEVRICSREDVEVSLPRRARGESNFNYRVGAVE